MNPHFWNYQPMTPAYVYPYGVYPVYPVTPHQHWQQKGADYSPYQQMRDEGRKPYVVNIKGSSSMNSNYRTTIWTGKYLQVTLMSIDVGDDIGLEVHQDHDQFLRIEDGAGIVQIGKKKDELTFQKYVHQNDAIMVPAGMWHNITNIGHTPLKLYSIYAPPEHPVGTIHQTKDEAIAEEHEHHHQYKK